MSTDVDGINATLGQYVEAANAGNVEAWAATLTDDVVFMPPDSPTVSGRDAVVAWVTKEFFDPFTIRLQAKFNQVHVFGSLAFAPGSFSLDLTPKSGGKQIQTTGKSMNVFRKQPDGSWKYAQVIFNWDKPMG